MNVSQVGQRIKPNLQIAYEKHITGVIAHPEGIILCCSDNEITIYNTINGTTLLNEIVDEPITRMELLTNGFLVSTDTTIRKYEH